MKNRKKIISTLLSFTMIGSLITGCDKGENLDENKVDTTVNNLDFTFDVNPTNFEVNITANDKIENVSRPMEDRKVENLKKTEDEISWTYPEENIEVSIEKEENYIDVDIKSNIKEENNFTWPSVDGDNYILPLHEGKYIPSDDKYFKEFLNESVYNVLESFSMQFFAVEKEDYALTYVIKNKFNNDITFDATDDISFEFSHEYPSINENKEYGFRIYVTENDAVDVAKTYKNYIVEKGEFTTLKEKAMDNKEIEKLYGAPHIYFWDMSIIGEADINWNKLKSMPTDLENWVKKLLTTEVEDGAEMTSIFDEIKTDEQVNDYQKTQILRAFNSVMKLEEFYNEELFTDIDEEMKLLIEKGTENLNKIELVRLNKLLLKSKLGDITTDVDDWAKENTINVLEDMKNSGLDNAWIGFDDIEAGYVSPEFANLAKEYNYLVAPYDSYHSIHEPGKEQWSTATFEDTSLYENATVENKQGIKRGGFQNTGRKLNPTLAHDSVANRVSDIVNTGYGFNSWFIDCDATGEIYDDYSKHHTTTQEEDLNARLQRMSYIRDEHNMVIGSEGGNDFASQTIAFAHGIETPAFSWVDPDMSKNKESEYYVGRYYSPTGGVPEVFAKQVPVKELYKKIYLDQTYSLPLFRLVYNDSVITSHQWLWPTFKVEDEVDNRMMQEILYNTAPMYHIDKNEWEKHKDDIINQNEVWSDFNKKAITKEMTDFKILSEDRLVQMSKFGEDLVVVANFSDEDFEYEGDNIAKNSLVIYDNDQRIIYNP